MGVITGKCITSIGRLSVLCFSDGQKIKNKRENFIMIRLTKPRIDTGVTSEIRKILASGWLTQGPVVSRFEKLFHSYIGSRYA
ncbi:MAG: hypothetical protein GF384_08275, partial [Elusimicrobia bacterium]|nr:hypothetical protein [Elusimicrobiota bacterium]MBD3412623.1 hypothetical protein [Elusimicrobiota bacterium]